MQNELLGKTLKKLYMINKKKMVEIYILEILNKFFSGDSCRKINNFVSDYIEFLHDYDFYYRNSKEFIDVYHCYRMVLEDLSKMGRKLNWDNEMKLFSGYIYLLENGYLSLDHWFGYFENADSCFELFGSNIMLGKGDCKHINVMLMDLFNINDFSSYVISMLIDENLISLNDMNYLNLGSKSIVDKDFSIDKKLFLSNDDSNHVAVLFVDDNHSYVMDATNDTIYYVGNDLGVYQDGHQFNVCYRDFYNERKNYELSQLLKPSSSELLISRLEDYYEVCNNCHEMIDIFEKFYQEHKDVYSEVVEKRKVLIKAFNKYHIFQRIKEKY